ncbi:protein-export membrane protein SecD [Enterovibrio norvegicus FF-33]|uniref:Protein translocase subunit SecD n=1 Tax=Enterovibrio norvegicus FF-454 TaxID=1185651 RepID=A0A1E5C634_9GAMM|nr:protein-export membrane protein SecD [Enterovibrio norvegicus FF-454]OEE68218.1 protein-export membrane protein SecD [Enterovibrio norvegicus FF-33]OEE74976.1 protein-export membrane protein SecD [Enterovibrio norvegicus FF-162]
MKPKTSRTTMLNHYPAWKYVVLITTLIIMLFSALPSWFGENAAVLISHKGTTPSAVVIQKALSNKDIEIKRIDQAGNKTTVVLDNVAQQNAAKNILEKSSNPDDTVALAMVPAAPGWLLDMGFKPIKLGLDLRGGVQFLLDVDMDQVFHAHANQAADSVRDEARELRIRGVRVQVTADDSLRIVTPSGKADGDIRQYIREQYPQWDVKGSGDNALVMHLKDSEKQTLTNLTVQQNLQTMRSRIEELGITEAAVQRQGEHRIRIELPGVQDPASAKNVIGATASLAFYEVVSEAKPGSIALPDSNGQSVYVNRKPVLSGEHIVDARGSMGEMGMPEVNISLDATGGKTMSDFSANAIGEPMATAYSEYSRNAEGKTEQTTSIISVATIQSQLGNRFRITGVGSLADAQDLALLLRAGSLTAPVTIVEERTIGPSLGAENIQNGFAALALGMGLTLLFMAVWYRKLGLVANLALVINMVMLLGLIALLPGAVLTLPGIAGLVLTIGMAVDTNVLIFERIKEKMREGRSLAQSIDLGFSSAFGTILDSNITTLISAATLYAIGNGPIQGFALTLGLGLLTSMFTGIFASRAVINLCWGKDTRRGVRI